MSGSPFGYYIHLADPVGGAPIYPLTNTQLRASPIPVSIEGSDVTVSISSLSGLDVSDRSNRILGRVGVDILTNVANLATDTGLASVYARLGDGSAHVIIDSMPSVTIDTTLLATKAKQDIGNTSVASIDTKTPALVSGRVPVDGSGVTQPISVASLPLPTNAAQDRTTASSYFAVRATDGAGFIAIALDSTVQAVRDRLPSALVGGRLDVNVGAGTIAISNFPATQPVSGTVTANVGTTNGLALDATLTGGTQKAIARGAAKGSTAAGDVTSSAVDANTQALHVSIKESIAVPVTDNAGSLSVDDGGGSITVDGTVSVSGTTAISAASLPLPTGASTEATLALIKAKTDNLDVALSTRAVTGLTDAQLRASAVPVSGTVTANIGTSGSLALDATLTGGTTKAIARGGAKGTTTAADVTSTAEGANNNALDVQIYHGGAAKDPTAIRALTSADVVTSAQGTAAALAAAWPVKVTDGTNTMPTADAAARKAFMALTDGTNTAAVKAASTAAAAADQAAVVSLSPNSPVTPPTLTKSTQGATGFSTQDLKDAGRVSKVFQGSAIAGVTAEALISLVMLSDLAAAAGATTYTVTAGKRFRMQAMILTWRNNTAAAGGVTVRLRAVASGTATASSPVLATLNATTSLATVGSGQTAIIDFPDGLELPAGANFGISQIAVGAVVGFDVELIGYEY